MAKLKEINSNNVDVVTNVYYNEAQTFSIYWKLHGKHGTNLLIRLLWLGITANFARNPGGGGGYLDFFTRMCEYGG